MPAFELLSTGPVGEIVTNRVLTERIGKNGADALLKNYRANRRPILAITEGVRGQPVRTLMTVKDSIGDYRREKLQAIIAGKLPVSLSEQLRRAQPRQPGDGA